MDGQEIGRRGHRAGGVHQARHRHPELRRPLGVHQLALSRDDQHGPRHAALSGRRGKNVDAFSLVHPEDDPGDQEESTTAKEIWTSGERSCPKSSAKRSCWSTREDMNHAEAAEIMGCKEATVSWHIHEAKKTLQGTFVMDDDKMTDDALSTLKLLRTQRAFAGGQEAGAQCRDGGVRRGAAEGREPAQARAGSAIAGNWVRAWACRSAPPSPRWCCCRSARSSIPRTSHRHRRRAAQGRRRSPRPPCRPHQDESRRAKAEGERRPLRTPPSTSTLSLRQQPVMETPSRRWLSRMTPMPRRAVAAGRP